MSTTVTRIEYMPIARAAKLWRMSRQRIAILCSSGRVPGAIQPGREWLIPAGLSAAKITRRQTAARKEIGEIRQETA